MKGRGLLGDLDDLNARLFNPREASSLATCRALLFFGVTLIQVVDSQQLPGKWTLGNSGKTGAAQTTWGHIWGHIFRLNNQNQALVRVARFYVNDTLPPNATV